MVYSKGDLVKQSSLLKRDSNFYRDTLILVEGGTLDYHLEIDW